MNSVSNKLKNFLRSIDVYGKPIQMEFNLLRLFRTKISAIISIIIYFILFGITVYLFLDVLKKDNVAITAMKTRYTDPPLFNFTTSELSSSEDPINKGFFFYAVLLRNKYTGEILTKSQIDQVIYLEALNNSRNQTTGITTKNNVYEFLPCSNVFPSVNLTDRFQSNVVGNALCLNDTVNTIEGDFVSDIYRFMSFKLKACSASVLESKPTCLPQSQFQIARQNWMITILYTQYNIHAGQKGNSPVSYSLSGVSVSFSTLLYQKFDMYLSKSNVFSENNLFFGSVVLYQETLVYLSNLVKQESPSSKGTLFAFYLRSDNQYIKYKRTYKTFFDFFSQIGGLWKILMLAGVIIIVPYNIKLLKISIANRLYNIVTEDKREEVAKTYTYYVKTSLIAEQNIIVKFENKTPLECRIAIDYYKYERNKGINFSLKAFFSKVLCSNGRKTKLKRKLQRLSEETLMKELNISNVQKFAKKVNSLKRSLLKEKSIIMFSNANEVVSTDSLHVINLQHQLYTRINEADPVSLALYKEKFLLDGLRAMRNKIDGLDKNVDMNLLDLLTINRNYLAKYFMKNIDLIKLKFKNVNEAVLDLEDLEEKVEDSVQGENN